MGAEEEATGRRCESTMCDEEYQETDEEVDISVSELREFLKLKAIAKSESLFNRDMQNEAAHTLPVDVILACHLPRLFRAIPDDKAEAVWKQFLCGCATMSGKRR